jgi:hypothetical protein
MPVIFTVGFLVFEQHDKMMDLYHAAYPADPVKAAALNICAETLNFNRLDSGDRASCYAGTYGRPEPSMLIPTPQPTYAYSPSHLSGNDIRRQEANSSYLEGAQTNPAPAPVYPASQNPVLHPTTPHHYTHPHLSSVDATATQQ